MHAIYKSFGILNLGSKPINDHVLGPWMRWQDLISFSHFGNGEWSSSLPNINSLADLKINSLGHYFLDTLGLQFEHPYVLGRSWFNSGSTS